MVQWPGRGRDRFGQRQQRGPEHIRGLAAAGATHLQLVLDPIAAESIDAIGEVLADLDL